MTHHARAFRRLFTRKYLIGLFLLAGLSCASLYIMYEQNARQAGRAEMTMLAYGQKALSQRISFFANTLVTSNDPSEREVMRAELRAAAAEMLSAHEHLTQQRPTIGETPMHLPELDDIYFGGESPFDSELRTFLDRAEAIADTPPEELTPDSLLLREVNLLGMNTVMQTHDVITRIISYRAAREVETAKLVQSVLTALILILLAAEAVFLFEPVGRAIESSLIKSEKSERLAQEEARRANIAHDAKSNFLRVMSHEFRTPLNAVIGMTDLLRATPLDDQQQVYVRHLQDAGNHMLSLANDVLTVQQYNAGKLELSIGPADLVQEIEGVAGLLKTKTDEKGLSLTFLPSPDFDGAVMIDARRFRQVLINLIGNAVKFTHRGGITITADSAPVEAQPGDGAGDSAGGSAGGGLGGGRLDIEIRVIDTGGGVTPEKREKIFEEFEQAEQFGERSEGGVGLGLAISRSIIEALGGKLSLEETSKKGSTFLIRMRLFRRKAAPEEAPKPAAAAPAREGVGGRKILVADDNLPNRMIAAAYLKKAGYDVSFAENGREAVDAALADSAIATVFMDIEMPVMDGVEAVKLLRERQRARLPVVALTAHALPEDSERLIDAGFDEVIRKPINEAAIVECARRYLDKRDAA